MRHIIIPIIIICTFIITIQAQENDTCVAAIGSRIATGSEISFNGDYYPAPEDGSIGFYEGDLAINGLVLEGPHCENNQQYWRVFYDYYWMWIDSRSLASAYPISSDTELITIGDTSPQTLMGISFTPINGMGERLLATIPATYSQPNNGFRHYSREPFRVIAFVDYSSQFTGTSLGITAPGIYVFPNNGNIPTEEQAKMNAAMANIEQLGESIFLDSVPSTNAGMPLIADGTRVDLSDGRGFRYLTYFTQAAMEVPDELDYIYQGFTDDGYFVAGVFPVKVDYSNTEYGTFFDSNPGLFTLASGTDEFQDLYRNMIASARSSLSSLDHAAFTPNLDDLDNMMRSIQVNALPEDTIYVSGNCDLYPSSWQQHSGRTASVAPSFLRAGVTAQRIGENASILRQSPGTDSPELARVRAGETVQVLSDLICNGDDYAWFEVQYGDIRGYVAEGYDTTRWFIPIN